MNEAFTKLAFVGFDVTICTAALIASAAGGVVYGVLGAAFASGVITFIFRKEIAELISDAKNITKESLLRFVNMIKRFRKKK